MLIDKLMDLVSSSVILIILCVTIPIYLPFQFLYSILLRTPFFPMEDMAGKVVVVTGASSGIGEELVYEYARRGALLVLVARRKNLLEEVAEKARHFGSKDVLVICADVSKVEDCQRFIDEAINHFGRLDHLVNNAGITSICSFEEASDILNFAPMMDVNFWGSVYATHFAIPHLKKTKGKIVVISSVLGWMLAPRHTFYGASKAALINFYDSLRVELGHEITITIVSPGMTDSEMTRGKHLGEQGHVQVDEQLTNQMMKTFLMGMFPMISAQVCAKRIVDGACKGERSITEPSYYGLLYLLKAILPDFTHWFVQWRNDEMKRLDNRTIEKRLI